MRWLVTASAAWTIGVVLYLVAAVAWGGYDGLPSLVLLPVCAALASAAVVGLALLVGLVLRPTPLGRWWLSRRAWALGVAVGSGMVLCFGSAAGLTGEYMHPHTGERFEALHPAAALGGYFLLVFAVAHWPGGRSARPNPTLQQTAPASKFFVTTARTGGGRC